MTVTSVMPDLIRHLRSFERARTRSRIGTLRDDRMGAVNGMTAPLGHPDVFPARIPFFAKNGTDVRSPSVPVFRGLSSFPSF